MYFYYIVLGVSFTLVCITEYLIETKTMALMKHFHQKYLELIRRELEVQFQQMSISYFFPKMNQHSQGTRP